MPLLSIVTAAHAGRADFLPSTGESVAAQQLPPGWELEWLVQEDGDDPHLAEIVEAVPQVRYHANGQQRGIADTRNLALSRARGDLVRTLDSDDLLLPGALAGPIERFAEHPELHWVAARPRYLDRDGAWFTYFLLLPTGIVRPRLVGDYLMQHRMCPLHCAGLTMRTASVRALGGWAANPRTEDIELLAALSELTPGYLEPEESWIYRMHDGQTVHDPAWGSNLVGTSYLMVHNRIAAIRERV
ncbi:glycosyltransferase family 2 protein [Kutzneria sp. NPDC052558]|uniref:glycosyltransferase family 2 protein n=1 Tax=Kutzneria sp. NPDC052558 TaxID=3364121 RepID=UPI0037CC6E45